MSSGSVGIESGASSTWHSDFFGTVNEMPPEPVGLIADVLEAMATEPGFQQARRALLGDLRLAPNDPSRPFLERARERASDTGARVTYEEGDARQLPLPDGGYDAAFCDKVLIHVSPASRVLSEMARVTRRGGRVGALEWMPRFALSTTDPELADRYNDIYRKSVSDYYVSANLERHMHEAGLGDIEARTYVAHASSLEHHPFWRLFLLAQVPLFAHAGLISESDGQRFAADMEELNRRGEFSAAFIIRTAVGTKTA
jgi:SAM-dependent methyltransferase